MRPTLSKAYFARLRNDVESLGTVTGVYIDENHVVKVFARNNKTWVGAVDSPAGPTNTWIVRVSRVHTTSALPDEEQFGREEIAVTVTNPMSNEVSDPFPTSTDVP